MSMNGAPEILKMESLSLDDPTAKKEPAPGSSFMPGKSFLMSTFLEVSIRDNAKAYRYDVQITSLRGGRSLTKGPADDGHGSMRRTVCYHLLYSALVKSNGFGTGKGYKLPLVYNRQNVIYFAAPLPENFVSVDLDTDEDFQEVSNYVNCLLDADDGARVTLTRITSEEEGVIDLYQALIDFSAEENEAVSVRNRSFRTFLEMLTTAPCLFNETHVSAGASFFEKPAKIPKEMDMGHGKVMLRGLRKGVGMVEKDGEAYPALVVDAKTSAFFKEQLLIESVKEFGDRKALPSPTDGATWRRIEALFKDVRVVLAGQASRDSRRRPSFLIERISDRPATTLRMHAKDFNGTVADYYRKILGTALKYPQMPCAEVRLLGGRGQKDATCHYPLELLFVAADQKVPLEKADQEHTTLLQRQNTVSPEVRLDRIKEQLEKLRLRSENNDLLAAFGVSIGDFVMSRAGVRFAPTIQVGDGREITIDQVNASWKGAWKGAMKRYFDPVPIRKWVLLHSCRKNFVSVIKAFVDSMIQVTKRRGISVEKPEIVDITQLGGSLHSAFEALARKGTHFVMYVGMLGKEQKSKEDRRLSHDLLKVCEQHYSIVTQHVCIRRVCDVVQKNKLTVLDNIVHKANMKLGGLNVVPRVEKLGMRMELDSGDFLVIAYDVCHPPPARPQERRHIKSVDPKLTSFQPSVVGIVANCGRHPHAFIGDYHYQAARKEEVDGVLLARRTKWIFEHLERSRPEHSRPKHIIILRDGVSEGQHEMAKNNELEAIRHAISQIDPKYAPSFTLVITTKRHNKRFFMGNGDQAANTVPGTVIDRDVTRAGVTQFFMQSHFPLLGTVKMPQYDVLLDEAHFSMDELQAFVNCMCHSHQIVDSAISIPEPVYAADELAKRGWNNFMETKRTFPATVPVVPGSKFIDFHELTESLSYWHTPLDGIRFNA